MADSPPAAFRDPRTFVKHAYDEHSADLGEVVMNYATAGSPTNPPLLLIPGQTESWWGYEAAMAELANDFHVFAVDLRGQGRSTWTPGRYTLDNMGNDLVRFIATVIKRSVITSGCSLRRALIRVALGLCAARSGAGRGVRRPTVLRVRNDAARRPVDQAVDRAVVSAERDLSR